MAIRRTRVVRGLALAGLITLLVAFVRTVILSTEVWLIIVLWMGGAIMVLMALALKRSWKDTKA